MHLILKLHLSIGVYSGPSLELLHQIMDVWTLRWFHILLVQIQHQMNLSFTNGFFMKLYSGLLRKILQGNSWIVFLFSGLNISGGTQTTTLKMMDQLWCNVSLRTPIPALNLEFRHTRWGFRSLKFTNTTKKSRTFCMRPACKWVK